MKILIQWRRFHGACLTTLLLTLGAAVSAQQQQGATTQYGELDFGTRQYYPQGCTHSGNTAVCTFVFVQQGQTQPIHTCRTTRATRTSSTTTARVRRT